MTRRGKRGRRKVRTIGLYNFCAHCKEIRCRKGSKLCDECRKFMKSIPDREEAVFKVRSWGGRTTMWTQWCEMHRIQQRLFGPLGYESLWPFIEQNGKYWA